MTEYELIEEDRSDLADAFEQDKQLRWLERDRARAQGALLGAAVDVDDETLRTLQLEFAESRERLETAKREILGRLLPQFQIRAKARRHGGNAAVFTPAEEMQLTLPERHELMSGTRRNLYAFELKEIAQDRLRSHGWQQRSSGERRDPSPDAPPIPSPRQWRVYATVSRALGIALPAATPAAAPMANSATV